MKNRNELEVRYDYNGEIGYCTFNAGWVAGVTGKKAEDLKIGSGFDINGTYYTIENIYRV